MISRLTLKCNSNKYTLLASDSAMFGPTSLPAFLKVLGLVDPVHSHQLFLEGFPFAKIEVTLTSQPIGNVVRETKDYLDGKPFPEGCLFLMFYRTWSQRPYVPDERKIKMALEYLSILAGLCDKCGEESCECYAAA